MKKCLDLSVVKEAVCGLHRSDSIRAYLAVTGAGAGLQNLIWAQPGSSKTLVGAQFPYSQAESTKFVGRYIDKHLSSITAIQLATAAFFRAQEETATLESPKLAVGLGMTCAVQTVRDRRGEDAVYAAIRTPNGLWTVYVKMSKDMTREEQGQLSDLIGLNLLLYAAGQKQVPIACDMSHIEQGDVTQDSDGFIVLLPKQISYLDLYQGIEFGSGVVIDEYGNHHDPDEYFSGFDEDQKPIVMPGSFDPLHFGHDSIGNRVAEVTNRPVIFELSAANCDKASIGEQTLLNRALQFYGRWPILIQDQKLFIHKARRNPGTHFAIGADTAHRIVNSDPKYNDGMSNQEVLDELRSLGVRFYVVPRAGEQYADVSKNWLLDTIPDHLRDLFVSVPGNWNISSTKLRG